MSRVVFPPDLILLLSVDIVGSAAFKADAVQQPGPPSWVQASEAFYTDLPALIEQERRQLSRDGLPTADSLQLWKAIGDQLVFLARPADPHQLEGECLAFLKALHQAHRLMYERWGFGLHGVAWAFPEVGQNMVYRFQQDQLSGGRGFDLIGPDVDLGFRLVALAPEGELLIPLELRRLLPRQRLEVRLIDEASLKGIRLDPYPVLQLQVV